MVLFLRVNNFICLLLVYLSVSHLLFVFYTGVKIYAELYAWVAVFMLPINSALNPVLYTLTTKLFKQQLARIVYTWRSGTVTAASPADSSGVSMSSAPFNGRNSKNSASLTTSDVRKVVYQLQSLSPLKLVQAYALQNISLYRWMRNMDHGAECPATESSTVYDTGPVSDRLNGNNRRSSDIQKFRFNVKNFSSYSV